MVWRNGKRPSDQGAREDFMADNWYAVVDGVQAGPYSPDEMRRLWDERRIDNGTLVWKEGMENWVPAGEAYQPGGRPSQPGGSPVHPVDPATVRAGNPSLQGAPFQLAVKRYFNGYVTFTGRASRAEFWWAVLFNIIVALVLGVVDSVLFSTTMQDGGLLSGLYTLGTLLPSIAVGVRRLHDIDRSGWWMLLFILPAIGWIVLLIFHVTKSTQGPNRFGDTAVA